MDLLEVLSGYQGGAVVTAAHRLGVFDALGAQPVTVDVLAGKLDAQEEPLRALLDSLVPMGLAGRSGGGYVAAPGADGLRAGGELGLVVTKEAVFARLWQDLDRVVRTGEPLLASWRTRLEREPAAALAFLDALEVLARVTGPPLHELAELAPGRRVLDVGGGTGSYARALAGAGSLVTIVELPMVAEGARQRLADVAERVTVRAADVETAPACGVEPGTFDAALVSHLLQELPDADAGVAVLRAASEAVRPGGTVVVNEFARDEGPGGFGARFDLMMRLETGGAAYRVAELERMLRAAGLVRPRRAPFPGPAAVLCAEVV